MLTKIGALLGSVRFWIVTLTAIISILNGVDLLTVFQVWATAVVGIGTLDSVASRIGGAK